MNSTNKKILIAAVIVVLLVLLGAGRAIQVHLQEQAEARQRAEQMAKAQEAIKQLQQLGMYGQAPPNLANMPNLSNMNMAVMPGGNYSPNATMAMAKLMQSGISMGIASYLIQAKPQVLSQSNNSVRYSLTFPDGITSDTTITVTPGQSYTPSPADIARAKKMPQPVYRVQFSAKTESETKARIILRYFVPNSAIPASLQQRLQNKSAWEFHLVPSVYAGESNLGMDVVGDTSVEVTKEILKQTAEHGKLSKEFPTPLSRFVDILNAFKKETEHLDWLDQLNELEDCARNPTNPLTQKAFEQDPNYQKQTIDAVNEARSDVSQMTAMRFLNLATSVATDLVDGPLGAITAPVSSYNDGTLKGLADDRVNEAKKGLTDCNPYKGYGDTYPPLHGQVEYAYNRTWNTSGDNWTEVKTEKRQLTAEVDLGFDENGRNNSGVNGTGTFQVKTQSRYTNPKGYAEDEETLKGPVEVYAQLGGSGAVGWIRVDIGGGTLHGTVQHTDTFGSKPNNTHREWDNGQDGVSCKFTNVDLRKGGTYSSFVESDKGYGTCKIEIAPK